MNENLDKITKIADELFDNERKDNPDKKIIKIELPKIRDLINLNDWSD
jgi:hypothetical protein